MEGQRLKAEGKRVAGTEVSADLIRKCKCMMCGKEEQGMCSVKDAKPDIQKALRNTFMAPLILFQSHYYGFYYAF